MVNDGGPAKDKSLRDEFAGLVIQLFCSPALEYKHSDGKRTPYPNADRAEDAYAMADAMLTARDEPQTPEQENAT